MDIVFLILFLLAVLAWLVEHISLLSVIWYALDNGLEPTGEKLKEYQTKVIKKWLGKS